MDDKYYIQKTYELAQQSLDEGGFPAGAVIVKDGEIIAEGLSLGGKLYDPTGHSETSAIRTACQKLQALDLSDCTLYASLQPCMMCFSAANWANIGRIVYGCKKTQEMVKSGCYEGSNDIEEINAKNSHQIQLDYIGDFESNSLELIKQWESKL